MLVSSIRLRIQGVSMWLPAVSGGDGMSIRYALGGDGGAFTHSPPPPNVWLVIRARPPPVLSGMRAHSAPASCAGRSAACGARSRRQRPRSAAVRARCRPERPDTALHTAARHGHSLLLQTILGTGVVIETGNKVGATPLSLAAQEGHPGCLELLIAAKADVDTANKDGESPTWKAAENGHAGCLRLLIAAKANVDAAVKDGASPTLVAADIGHAGCLELLIAAKANVDAANEEGMSPTYVAAWSGGLPPGQEGYTSCLELRSSSGPRGLYQLPRAADRGQGG
eukprot:938092-Prymnesium_polylepis.1